MNFLFRLQSRSWFVFLTSLWPFSTLLATRTDAWLLAESARLLRGHERTILETGRALNPEERALARKIGVARPERVRIVAVTHIPQPEDPVLRTAWEKEGILLDRAEGLTMGYGIYLIKAVLDNRGVLAHELTHVAQYERFGGIEPFLERYLDQVRKHGYRHAPLEEEAFRNGERWGN